MMEDLDAAGVAEEDTTGKAKRRLEAGRRLVFGNARARVAVLLAVADLLVAIVFALLPDTRVESSTANSDQRFAFPVVSSSATPAASRSSIMAAGVGRLSSR